MTAFCRDAGSSVLVTLPVPLKLAEKKTQPSVARINVNSALGSEIDAVWSSCVTRLFCFFSTDDVNGDSAPLAKAQSRSERRPEVIGVARIGSQTSPGASELSCLLPPPVDKKLWRCSEC